jgi:hypothetical protein
MYSKEQIKAIRIHFWSEFKKKTQNKRSSSGRRINWLHYPSEIDFIFIRLDADAKGARLTFDIQGKDAGVREIIWEQMYELKAVLESEMGTSGIWSENISSSSVASFNQIKWENSTLNLFDTSNQAEIMDFLEERIISFDRFYQEFKDILINLAN